VGATILVSPADAERAREALRPGPGRSG
jgi:hypothetical protein